MPALRDQRQPEAMAWFNRARGRGLLDAERQAISGALVSRPGQQPWLWLAPCVACAEEPELPPGGLRLHATGLGFAGSVRCALPLPLPDEGVGNIILQHVLDRPAGDLLEECVRVLEPGGRMWLFGLNPLSPYRLRWTRSGLAPRAAGDWRQRLGGFGLQPCGGGLNYLGPVWSDAGSAQGGALDSLRAVSLLQVEKRTAAMIPPAPVKAVWQPGAAPA